MFLEAGLLTRRSVRQFEKGKKLTKADFEDLLKIAMYAPSGCNRQPWEFIVVEDDETKDKIMQIHGHAYTWACIFFERSRGGYCGMR